MYFDTLVCKFEVQPLLSWDICSQLIRYQEAASFLGTILFTLEPIIILLACKFSSGGVNNACSLQIQHHGRPKKWCPPSLSWWSNNLLEVSCKSKGNSKAAAFPCSDPNISEKSEIVALEFHVTSKVFHTCVFSSSGIVCCYITVEGAS